MHTVDLDVVLRWRGPPRRNQAPVRVSELWIGPARAVAQQLIAQAEAAQHAYAVRMQCDAGAHLAQDRRLLVHADVDAALPQRVGCCYAADSPADDRHL